MIRRTKVKKETRQTERERERERTQVRTDTTKESLIGKEWYEQTQELDSFVHEHTVIINTNKQTHLCTQLGRHWVRYSQSWQ